MNIKDQNGQDYEFRSPKMAQKDALEKTRLPLSCRWWDK